MRTVHSSHCPQWAEEDIVIMGVHLFGVHLFATFQLHTWATCFQQVSAFVDVP